MPAATAREIEAKIAECLEDFYKRRLSALGSLKLKRILRRKNPYLFRALGNEVASEIVQQILQAYLSSSDETIFGDAFFEPVALLVSGGKPSDGRGIDIIVDSPRRVTAIALKSGPNIFNASQRKRQNQEFMELRNRLYKLHKAFDPLLGYAYGSRSSEPSGERIYRERAGQSFWYELTGDPDFYLKLIRLMRDIPSRHRDQHKKEWGAAVNRFTKEFADDFCLEDGRIDWEKLVEFVSKQESVFQSRNVGRTARQKKRRPARQ